MPPDETQPWRKTLIAAGSSIADAIASLDASALQIALVVDAQDVLLGTITDGDVRRALLRGQSMTDAVDDVMYTNPLVVSPEMGRDTVLNLMRINKIHQMPVVDENRRVLDLHTWDEIVTPSLRENTMVIMAGGFGTRLLPHTEVCPKPMLPVGGKPMLEHIIERAFSEGFQRFIISLHYLPGVITDYFGDGDRWGVSIDYVYEENPLGTAGALSLIEQDFTAPLIVTNGDVLTGVRYGEMVDFHVSHQSQATMAVSLHEWQHPFGVVQTKGVEIVGFEEKPVHRSHINAGIYVLEPATLELLQPAKHCDMPSLFQRVQEANGRIIAYPMHENWIDVGRPEDLHDANSRVSET